jgi:hypothetical protein
MMTPFIDGFRERVPANAQRIEVTFVEQNAKRFSIEEHQ